MSFPTWIQWCSKEVRPILSMLEWTQRNEGLAKILAFLSAYWWKAGSLSQTFLGSGPSYFLYFLFSLPKSEFKNRSWLPRFSYNIFIIQWIETIQYSTLLKEIIFIETICSYFISFWNPRYFDNCRFICGMRTTNNNKYQLDENLAFIQFRISWKVFCPRPWTCLLKIIHLFLASSTLTSSCFHLDQLIWFYWWGLCAATN